MPPKKGQKMALGTFLQDETLGSWADEMEDMPITTDSRTSYGGDRRAFSSAGGMGMGNGWNDRQDRYPPREELPLPTQPPYTAHIGNMAFDTTQGDVSDFFRDCDVTNVRIVEDKIERKPKGFGYIEFGSLEGLKKALTYSNSNLAGRNIRVSVADPPKDRQDGRDFGNWDRKGPLPDLPGAGQRRVSDRPPFPGRGNFDNMSDAGSERGGRRPFEQGDGKVRDFSNWERKGPLSPAAPAAPSLREGGRQGSRDGPGFRRSSPAWGEGKSQEGSRPPRREYQEKPIIERAPTAAELDNKWRSNMRPDQPAKSPTPETSAPPSPAPPAALTSRPKLNLQKRTVSEADPALSPASITDSRASPFGAARPVDTAAKEKEVAEKREIALRQKREADEKARAEKAEEKRLAREKADQEKAKAAESKEPKGPKETKAADEAEVTALEADGAQAKPKFDILRRVDSTNDMIAEEEGEEEGAEGAAAPAVKDDKAAKPKEAAALPPSKANGSWRGSKDGPSVSTNQHSAAAAAPSTSTSTTTTPTMGAPLEEDGWSTVSKPTKQRNNRRSNAPSRAAAS